MSFFFHCRGERKRRDGEEDRMIDLPKIWPLLWPIVYAHTLRICSSSAGGIGQHPLLRLFCILEHTRCRILICNQHIDIAAPECAYNDIGFLLTRGDADYSGYSL